LAKPERIQSEAVWPNLQGFTQSGFKRQNKPNAPDQKRHRQAMLPLYLVAITSE